MFIFSFFFYDAASTQIYPHLHTLSLHDALPSFAAILDVLAAAPPEAAILARCADIDRLFAADTVEEIFAALAADGGDWAAGQRAILETKSPQTRSEEHTSELQSLMRISYAVFCLKKKKSKRHQQ